MKDIKTYTGNITATRRMKSSVNGNPRYAVSMHTDDGKHITFCTATDCSFGYQITNYDREGIRVRVEVGSHYRVQTLNDIEQI